MTTLKEPFDKTFEKGGFTYVSWSQVADRLDEAAPGWSFSIIQFGEDWALGRLVFDGRSFDNFGYAENASADWKKEALKDAASDALKRCAAMAGVARYLYDKDDPRITQGRTVGAPPVARPAPSGNGADRTQAASAPAPVGSVCPKHNIPWKGEPGSFYHGPKDAQGHWCRPDGQMPRRRDTVAPPPRPTVVTEDEPPFPTEMPF